MRRQPHTASAAGGEAAPRRAGRGRALAYYLGIVLLGVVSIGGFIALRAADPFVVQQARQISFDLLQRTTPRTYVEVPVRIIDIDEQSLEKLGQWPWPRDVLAEMVDRLHAVGVAAIAFDFLFVEPDRISAAVAPDGAPRPSNDDLFADALRRGNVVLGFGAARSRTTMPPLKAGFAFTGAEPGAFVTPLMGGASVLPILADAAAGIGSVNLRRDDSGEAVRAIQILWSNENRLYPSLVSEALRIAQGASTYVVNSDPEIGGLQSVRIGAFDVPVGAAGEFIVYYTKPRAERYVSAADLFDNERLAALAPDLGGKIVFIGTSAAGLFDLHRTALGDIVPGVEMHAQALEQILSQQFLLRKDWIRAVELLAVVVASLTVGIATIMGGALFALLWGATISGLIAVGAWYAFQEFGLLVDFSFPLGSGLAIWFIATAFRYLVTDREKRGIRHAFSRYVHPTVLRDIERNYSELRLGGERCELTVLFTDVRNFTTLSERLEPEELVGFLNRLLGALGDEIARTGGVIDKFIGDSVMAFWNAPLRQPDHARRACLAALEMRKVLDRLTESGSFGLPDDVVREMPIAIGVGINTGLACVGNVGSSERFNYSAIGDAVNIAARAESACKDLAFDLVVSRATAEQAPDLAFLEAGGISLKGKSERVVLMALVGDAAMKASPEFRDLERLYARCIAALRDRDQAAIEAPFALCRRAAVALEPRLGDFLDRVRERPDDFQTARAADYDLVAAK